jgi:hypothetical protein
MQNENLGPRGAGAVLTASKVGNLGVGTTPNSLPKSNQGSTNAGASSARAQNLFAKATQSKSDEMQVGSLKAADLSKAAPESAQKAASSLLAESASIGASGGAAAEDSDGGDSVELEIRPAPVPKRSAARDGTDAEVRVRAICSVR